MIAARLSAVGQVAGVAAAALCCYLASQWVASERTALAKVEHQIASAQDDIRRLGTEISARSRMGQLDRWNSEVLALQAPRPRQFVANGVQLASLYGHARTAPLPLDPAIVASQGAVATVSYTAPAPVASRSAAAPIPVAPSAEQPMLRSATYFRASPSALAPDRPMVTHVAYTPDAPGNAATTDKTAKGDKPNKSDRSAKPAVRLASLLPADIGTLAAAEAKSRKASPTRVRP